jgi:hypothetical protein
VTHLIKALREAKLVPSDTGDSTLRNLKQAYKARLPGQKLKDWREKGRPSLKSIPEVEAFVDEAAGTVSGADMMAELNARKKANAVAKGLSALTVSPVSTKSGQRYMHMAAELRHPVNKTIDKTRSRWAAERSLRALAGEVAVMTSMLYRPCGLNERASGDDLTNPLAAMAADAFGVNEVVHVDHALVTNTDGTTVFKMVTAPKEQIVDFRVAATKAEASSSYATFKLDEHDGFHEGLRVELIITVNMAGMMADLHLNVKNLNERELSPSRARMASPPSRCQAWLLALLLTSRPHARGG